MSESSSDSVVAFIRGCWASEVEEEDPSMGWIHATGAATAGVNEVECKDEEIDAAGKD